MPCSPEFDAWPEPDEARSDAVRAYLARWGVTPRRTAIYDQAFTHASFAHEEGLRGDNERLEFLGDTLINYCVALWLYQSLPGAHEGELSKRKAALVSRTVLGRRARAMGLEEMLRLGRGDSRSGPMRSSVMGSGLEALAGAVLLDGGMEVARVFIFDHIIQPCHEDVEATGFRDHKSRFQEAVQGVYHEAPRYMTVSEAGPDHDKRFVTEVLVGDKVYGSGEGRRKKSAENQAAKAALRRFLEEQTAGLADGSGGVEPGAAD